MQVEKVRMVRGPATVRVNGICRLLGMDVSGKTVQVRAGKVLPFELGHGCVLVLEGGDIWDADPSSTGTAIWTRLVKRILAMSSRRLTVMLVGATDTGKSTLSTYIANAAIGRGLAPCVIDGDIGQGDLAPPTAIGAALVSDQVVDLRDVAAGYYEFVGSVTPAGSERLVACRMKSMLARTRRISRLHIINTDGYVTDRGAAYKKMLARALAPTVIVCLGRNEDLTFALAQGPWLFLHARSSSQVVKTQSERAGRRMDQFMRHVGGGLADIDVSKIRFIYRGKPASLSMVIRLFAPASIEGTFVGLGLCGIVIGFGVIESLDDKIRIRSGIRDFDTVYLSNVALKGAREERLD